MSEILDEILANQDPEYRDFHSRLVPTVNNLLGLRGPVAKQIAKKYANTNTGREFLADLPHTYYEENLVHGYMLGFLKTDTQGVQAYLEAFLPYVDNWAVCDSMTCALKRFFKNPDEVYGFVFKCLQSKHTYTVRFALVSLLSYYVNDSYINKILNIAAKITSEEYYIKMANAWLISVCIVKQYEKTVEFIKQGCLDVWTHNKAIQKATESYRIDSETKNYLRSLKRK